MAVILSGTGTDGTLGVQTIKGESGLVAIQSPETAEFSGMPASTLATGVVDISLPANQLFERLLAYARAPHLKRPEPEAEEAESVRKAMPEIARILQSRTGHDFSGYKISTLRRRIERRMAISQIEHIGDYARRLQQDRSESQALFRDLLIGVTSFFRDAACFKALGATALKALLAAKPDRSAVRVWVPACSTGEETYSIAMLLIECLDQLSNDLTLQIFATDIAVDAIDIARAGSYADSIAADVGSERLQRFFVRERDRYVVKKDIRAQIIFATQDLLKDPPFTKLDLISCRNLLIYFDGPAQDRVIPLLHYALNRDGILLLGPSEGIGKFEELFSPVDRKHKIFQRIGPWPSLLTPLPKVSLPTTHQAAPQLQPEDRHLSRRADLPDSFRELLASCYAPPAVLVDARGRVLQIHGRVGAFLELPPGHASLDVLAMAREGLRSTLSAALRAAARRDGGVVRKDTPFPMDGKPGTARVAVRKIAGRGPLHDMMLISFEPSAPDLPGPARSPDGAALRPERGPVARLNAELLRTRDELQGVINELQQANEELTSFSEESQSVNEELQSTNTELQSNLDLLADVNDDLRNLLDSTQIATIFLDCDLRLKSFSRDSRHVIPLIAADVGRPIGDIVTRLEYSGLASDATTVLQTLESKQVEAQSKGGNWFSVNNTPYRTSSDRIAGVVVTFFDVTLIKEAEQRVREARDYAESIIETVREPLVILDEALRVISANPAFYCFTATSPPIVEGIPIHEVAGGSWSSTQLHRLLQEILSTGEPFNDLELTHDVPATGRRRLLLNARPVRRESGRSLLILLAIEEVTDHPDRKD